MAATPTSAPEGYVSLRDVFGDAIMALGARDPRIVMLDADLASSTRTMKFGKTYPDRHYNFGIAEQNMVGAAAGFAIAGYIPFVNTFASFLTRRACDQIAISVAYPQLNVKFFGFHGGINLGEDGATQQAVEDLGIMQAIPGIRCYAPIDGNDLARVMNEVADIEGPTYVRLSRFPSPLLTPPVASATERAAACRVLAEGDDLLVLTTSTLAAKVVEAAAALKDEGIGIRLLGITRLKPLGAEIADEARKLAGKPIAVVEEHSIHGGLADGLSALLDGAGIAHRIERIGVPDRFGESGHPDALLEAFGLAGAPLRERLRAAARG
ncbi:transketolase family protein [Pleomorphomonas koreensis]|uniref:transketolase family protein n=1 Tax=Pleomorphomonas koreensis TaxID=257440 RepID=UPI000421BCD9|nr:transketolase C-terminal domain-containing protein [Pleomorphomonas koreensis]